MILLQKGCQLPPIGAFSAKLAAASHKFGDNFYNQFI
jgi:hypothetical protein